MAFDFKERSKPDPRPKWRLGLSWSLSVIQLVVTIYAIIINGMTAFSITKDYVIIDSYDKTGADCIISREYCHQFASDCSDEDDIVSVNGTKTNCYSNFALILGGSTDVEYITSVPCELILNSNEVPFGDGTDWQIYWIIAVFVGYFIESVIALIIFAVRVYIKFMFETTKKQDVLLSVICTLIPCFLGGFSGLLDIGLFAECVSIDHNIAPMGAWTLIISMATYLAGYGMMIIFVVTVLSLCNKESDSESKMKCVGGMCACCVLLPSFVAGFVILILATIALVASVYLWLSAAYLIEAIIFAILP